MVTYKYSAISKAGVKVNGVVEAYNELEAVDKIKETCDTVLKINAIDEENPGILNMQIGGEKLNKKAFTLMCSQFAIILRAGMPVDRTVRLIAGQTTDKTLKKTLTKVAADVETGRSLSVSFEEHGGKYLPVTFIETIRAGEESGNIDGAFQTMYEHYDKQMKIAGKVRNAMIYPIFVLIVAVVVVIVLMVFVVPTFTAVFASLDTELPIMTQMLISISNFFAKYWIVLAVVIAAIILVYKLYSNMEGGRLNLAKIARKLPVFGKITVLNAASQFANNMTTLIGAGLSITRSIKITAKVMDNYYYSLEVGKLSGKVEQGKTLGDSLRESGCMPAILTDMVGVGEDTGELEETLDTTAEYYDNELSVAVNNAIALLEPAMLIVLAVIAGFIVIAMYSAMFSMYSNM